MKAVYQAIVIFTLHILLVQSSESTKYTWVAPKTVQAGKTLTSLLTIHYSNPTDVNISLSGNSANPAPYSIVSVTGDGGITVLPLSIPSGLSSGTYNLHVTNDVIKAMVSIEVKSSSHAIIIQTDKPIYKPSQTVRVRVAIIDENLIPVNMTIKATIEDTESNTIAQWRDLATETGLTQFELPLSDQPPLGDWKVIVESEESKVEKSFKIEQYVLPKFEVNIELPSYVLTSASVLPINVSAVYTFGEPVSGKFKFNISSGTNQQAVIGPLSATGRIEQALPSSSLNLRSGQDITVYAEVIEPLSGKKMNTASSVKVYESDYLITFMDISSESFLPGRPYTAYFDVGRPDGSRIENEEMTLELTASYYANSSNNNYIRNNVSVPLGGITPVTVTIPSGYTSYLTPKLYVRDKTISGITKTLERFTTLNVGVSFSILSNITGVLKVGDAVSVDVSCSSNSGRYFYAAVARGKPVISGTGQLSSPSFTLKVTQDFTPQVTIIAYAVVNNELVGDSVSTNVDGVFENQVSLEIQDSDGNEISVAEPGDNVNVKIDTEAGSLIGLLSVDKSILLLGGSDNDVTQSQILTAMMSLFESAKSCSGNSNDGPVFRFSFFPRFGGKSTQDVFAAAGMSVVTDGMLARCYDDIMPVFAMEDGMMARGSGIDGNENAQPEEDTAESKPRQEFPQTWLWSLDHKTVRSEVVPDTITSWITTAISMHPTKGIAVSSEPAQLTVKLPFFISPSLPYSAVRGEELPLKIMVYNYGESDKKCTVTVFKSDGFEFDASGWMSSGDDVKYNVSVAMSEVKMVSVGIRLTAVGTVSIRAGATCTPAASDSFIRELIVKPPGKEVEQCETKFVQLAAGANSRLHVFNVTVPDYAVEGSKRVTVSVTGDVMGSSINGLDNLVRMPYGCGEQNMISFTPNIFVRRYLESINKLTSEMKQKTEKYMLTGYQRELTYRHSDGSFSAFGERDPSGSTWQASDYIKIDTTVMKKANESLFAQLNESGNFTEPGKVIHKDMQGGSSKGLTLTAYVIIAMLEDVSGDNLTNRRETLEKSKTYLEGQFERIKNDPYTLAIVTYALRLVGSTEADRFLGQLESLQKSENGMVWWAVEQSVVKDNLYCSDCPKPKPSPSSVEMTSYALLTYLYSDDLVKSKPIVEWLTENRGSSGGFTSTQDTVLGLQALAVYSEKIVSESTNVKVNFTAGSLNYTHSITEDNAIVTKYHTFNKSVDITSVSVNVSGQGSAIVSTCFYYNDENPTASTVNVTSEVVNLTYSNQLALRTCLTYLGQGESGMGIIIAHAATCAKFVLDDVKVITGELARVDPTSEGAALYFDKITEVASCVDVPVDKDCDVGNMQNSVVIGAQYYKPDLGSESFYNLLGYTVVSQPPATNAASTTDKSSTVRQGNAAVSPNLSPVLILLLWVACYLMI